jgi:hypothetical protein
MAAAMFGRFVSACAVRTFSRAAPMSMPHFQFNQCAQDCDEPSFQPLRWSHSAMSIRIGRFSIRRTASGQRRSNLDPPNGPCTNRQRDFRWSRPSTENLTSAEFEVNRIGQEPTSHRVACYVNKEWHDWYREQTKLMAIPYSKEAVCTES